MRQYNVIYTECNEPGLHIMETDSYVKMVQEDPGRMHENWGDFYTDVPKGQLADRIFWDLYDNLEILVEDAVVVDGKDFDYDTCDSKNDYIINYKNKIVLYSPEAHGDWIGQFGYMLVLECMNETVISQNKKGSIAEHFDEEEETLVEQVKEIKTMGQKLSYAFEKLEEEVKGLEKEVADSTQSA